MIWIWKTLWDSAKNTRAHVRQPQSVLPNFYLRKAAVLRKLVENEKREVEQIGAVNESNLEIIKELLNNFWCFMSMLGDGGRHLSRMNLDIVKKSSHFPGLNCLQAPFTLQCYTSWHLPWEKSKMTQKQKTWRRRHTFIHMDVSENGGTPKSSILIGFSIINHPFWGTRIFGNIHITNG